jgi:hypothetical protein
MTIEPVYVKVVDARRSLRVTATRQSPNPQLVRISAAEVPSKMSHIWSFETVELRPGRHQSAEVNISPLPLQSYWLAIQVFSNTRSGWFRSSVATGTFPVVPIVGLAFTDDFPATAEYMATTPSVVLSIVYP